MKVEYSLTKTEYDNIEQMFEDIPIRLCDYVKCPDCEGGMRVKTVRFALLTNSGIMD